MPNFCDSVAYQKRINPNGFYNPEAIPWMLVNPRDMLQYSDVTA